MVAALNVMFVLGLAAFAYGCGLLHPALWWIVGGGAACACAYYAMRWQLAKKAEAV